MTLTLLERSLRLTSPALFDVELGESAMVIAEQNVALLDGRVDRIIGMHVGKLKGEAAASLAYQTKREI